MSISIGSFVEIFVCFNRFYWSTGERAIAESTLTEQIVELLPRPQRELGSIRTGSRDMQKSLDFISTFPIFHDANRIVVINSNNVLTNKRGHVYPYAFLSSHKLSGILPTNIRNRFFSFILGNDFYEAKRLLNYFMHGTCEEGPKSRRRVNTRKESTKVQLPEVVEPQPVSNMSVPLSKYEEYKLEFLSNGTFLWTNHTAEEDTYVLNDITCKGMSMTDFILVTGSGRCQCMCFKMSKYTDNPDTCIHTR